MNILLVPMGSAGDVHPHVALGLRLQARGHDVTMFTSSHFAELAARAGLDLVPIGSEGTFEAALDDPDLWHRTRGVRVLAHKLILPYIRELYDALASRCAGGDTVIAASVAAFGARLLNEHRGVPLATVHLQPALFRSIDSPPIIGGLPLRGWMPRWMRRLAYRVGDAVADHLLLRGLNAVRGDLGLPRLPRFVGPWSLSPQRVIGLFPAWYAAPQPDWPPQTRLAGFPLYDESGLHDLSADLESFLAAGDAPIAFTPGSAMRQGAAFFRAAVDACGRLDRRGLLLTKYAGQLPPLPPSIRHESYVPFSAIFPRCAAIVHHGGIGTSAQALRAGVPQLIMPMSHDQPDNAARLETLGVAGSIRPARFRGPAVARMLSALLGSPRVAESCRRCAARFADARSIDQACDWIEELARPAAPQRQSAHTSAELEIRAGAAA